MADPALWQYLMPGDAEGDESFRKELLRVGRLGLKVVAGIELAVPVFMFCAELLVLPSRYWTGRIWQTVSVALIGAITWVVAHTRWGQMRARLAAWISGFVVSAVLVWSSLLLARFIRGSSDYIPGQITTVMLVAVAAIPFRPLDTLGLGFSISAFYLASEWIAREHGILPAADWDPSHHVFSFMLTLLSTALTAVVYAQRWMNFRVHQKALKATTELCTAQSRALLSENAAGVGRLTAALTHELNTPLGALKSSVDTMLVIAGRQATAPPQEQQRLVSLQAELRRSVGESVKRLQKVIGRLQRFVDLDKADLQQANLNELLTDVAILFEQQIRDKVKLEFELRPLPPLTCRPQQLSAVFSSLLSNAINALNGDGRIVVATEQKGTRLEVRIQDNGRGMSAEEMASIFDPGFKVAENRVSTGNWSLFSSRQIVYEHGGDIRIESAEGKGTTVWVTLPGGERP